MQIGKNQASQPPTAFGSMLQASTYGMVIPVIYGLVQSPLLAIWANNLRQGGSGKKGKGGGKKGGPPTYVEAIDFLVGKNPILGINQIWNNNAKIPLNYTSVTAASASSITVADTNCYAIIAVTLTQSYNVTFNDYGAAGPTTLTGSYEVPLWNQLQAGPDPVNNNVYRNFPYTYRWQPSYNRTIYLDNAGGAMPSGTITIYYAQMTAATSNQPPLARQRLSFENILGSGTEYAGYASQQIQYPWYAGVGSSHIDLGSSGTIPALKPEVQGKWAIYPTGDCDYVDIIEDVLKSGITQSAIGGTLGFGPTQHGVACYDFPGAVQKKLATLPGTVSFDMPVTAGNTLVAICVTAGAGPVGVSDTLANTWTTAATGTMGTNAYGVFYKVNTVAGADAVSFTGMGASASIFLLELEGVDSFDAKVTAVGANANPSIATTNTAGLTSLILGISVASTAAPGQTMLWPEIMTDGAANFIQQRKVTNPGTYSLGWTAAQTTDSLLLLLAFKATVPATYPNPLPDILDASTRELARLQCRAGGLWGAISMNAQKAAADWIKDMCDAANIAPVWSGFRLKLIPRSEVSAVGNGAIYNAPTASGPVANLDDANGDFIAGPNESPIVVVRKARTDLNTILQMQHLNRASDYHQIVTAEPDEAGIALYGVRKADPITNNAIMSVAVARAILRILVRRQNYVENVSYRFKANARWGLLEPMDLITVTDTQQGITQVPVRLTSVEEDDQFGLVCEAEPFGYGISAPQSLPVTNPAPYVPTPNATAGNVNAPVIFEPVPQLYGQQNQAQLWLAVSSSSPIYGGCQVMISTDGGASYNSAGDPIVGNAITGVTTASWAAAASPDTTNDLPVDLTESLGVLNSYAVADEDNHVYPCYVAGTSTPIPYELMTYATATLTAANKYTLKATGTGNHLDRGVFGAPTLNTGALHASGSRFAVLLPDGQGLLKLTMDPRWIGVTLYFKFLSMNTFGGAVQNLADVTAYTYTPTGGSGSVNPSGLPPQTFQVNGA